MLRWNFKHSDWLEQILSPVRMYKNVSKVSIRDVPLDTLGMCGAKGLESWKPIRAGRAGVGTKSFLRPY